MGSVPDPNSTADSRRRRQVALQYGSRRVGGRLSVTSRCLLILISSLLFYLCSSYRLQPLNCVTLWYQAVRLK